MSRTGNTLLGALLLLSAPLLGLRGQSSPARLVGTIDTGEDIAVVAAWSPDGMSLAYGTEKLVERRRSPQSYRDEEGPRRFYPGEVFVTHLAELDGKPKRILEYKDLRRRFGDFSYRVDSLSWSPDGARLAVELTNENNESATFFFTPQGKDVKVGGKGPNFVTGYGGDWLADNESYALLSEALKPRLLHQVELLRLAAGREIPLFRESRFAAVAWLPKRQQVVAVERDREFSRPPQLVLGDLQKGTQEELAEVSDYLGQLAVTPDEERVSYFVGQEKLAVRELKPDSEITTLPVPLGRYAWAPSGNAIFYLEPEKLGRRAGRLTRLDLADQSKQALLDEILYDFWLSPDGKHVAVLTRGLEPSLKIYSPE